MRQIGGYVKVGLSVINMVPMFGGALAEPLKAVVGVAEAAQCAAALKALPASLDMPSQIQASVQEVVDQDKAVDVYKTGVDMASDEVQERLFKAAYKCWRNNQQELGSSA